MMHAAVGLAVKKALPAASLWLTVPAALALDIIAVPVVISGAITLGPLSHGLVMASAWAALALGLGWAIGRRIRWGLLPALLVLSHWFIDYICWPLVQGGDPAKDGVWLAFYGSPRVGFGLYTTTVGAIAFEVAGLLACLLLIVSIRRGKRAEEV